MLDTVQFSSKDMIDSMEAIVTHLPSGAIRVGLEDPADLKGLASLLDKKFGVLIRSVGGELETQTKAVNKNQEKILRKVSDIGWRFGTDGLSDSYILYKEIKMKIFKMRLLQYVLEKINKVLADEYFQRKEFRIEARTKNIDYVEVWEKYNKGELTVSDLNKILWHSLA